MDVQNDWNLQLAWGDVLGICCSGGFSVGLGWATGSALGGAGAVAVSGMGLGVAAIAEA